MKRYRLALVLVVSLLVLNWRLLQKDLFASGPNTTQGCCITGGCPQCIYYFVTGLFYNIGTNSINTCTADTNPSHECTVTGTGCVPFGNDYPAYSDSLCTQPTGGSGFPNLFISECGNTTKCDT